MATDFKFCVRCSFGKPLEDFGSNSARPDGLQVWCKPCMTTYHESYHYQRMYGVSIEEIRERYSQQEGICPICREHFEKLDVDHDHSTGRIRGLLCGNCNRALGILKDDPERLIRAIEYLCLQISDA